MIRLLQQFVSERDYEREYRHEVRNVAVGEQTDRTVSSDLSSTAATTAALGQFFDSIENTPAPVASPEKKKDDEFKISFF